MVESVRAIPGPVPQLLADPACAHRHGDRAGGREAPSVSVISDLFGWWNVLLGEGVFYVGVYVKEAISGQIAMAFTATGTSWQVAMRAVAIIRLVVAVLILLLVLEPDRQLGLVEGLQERGEEILVRCNRELKSRDFLAVGKEFEAALNYVMHLRSFGSWAGMCLDITCRVTWRTPIPLRRIYCGTTGSLSAWWGHPRCLQMDFRRHLLETHKAHANLPYSHPRND